MKWGRNYFVADEIFVLPEMDNANQELCARK